MKIAVLSGKGGAGKTFVSVNLAFAAGRAVYIDCDVEEPNGHLFLHPDHWDEKEVTTSLPLFDHDLCNGCRACVNFCHFNALVFIKHRPVLLPELCHSCGGCSFVCSQNAVKEYVKCVGTIRTGTCNQIQIVSGMLNVGEVSTVKIIQEALSFSENEDLCVIDCPPGSGCPVIESIEDADYCVLVTEPTIFGFHNFQMIHQLVALMNKPCGVVINKSVEPFAPLLQYCKEHDLDILADFPYDQDTARLINEGKIAAEYDKNCKQKFFDLLQKIRGEIK